MSPHESSSFAAKGRELEREAKAAKAEIERLAQAIAAVPAEVRASLHAQMETERGKLDAIVAQAERSLDDQRHEFAAHRALLESQVQQEVDQLERARIQASRAQAEAAYEAGRFQLESARSYAMDGIDLSYETLARHSRALDAGR